MDDNRKKWERKEFPKEFEYLENMINEPLGRIHAIEKSLENLPKTTVDKARFEYNPPGYARARKLETLSLSRSQMEHYRDVLDKDTSTRFEAQIRGVEPDVAQSIREAYFERRHPNRFENMGDKEFANVKSKEKDLDHSQDYMLRLQKDFWKKQSERITEPASRDSEILTPGERFSQTLSSQKQPEQPKEKDLSKSKGSKEPQRE